MQTSVSSSLSSLHSGLFASKTPLTPLVFVHSMFYLGSSSSAVTLSITSECSRWNFDNPIKWLLLHGEGAERFAPTTPMCRSTLHSLSSSPSLSAQLLKPGRSVYISRTCHSDLYLTDSTPTSGVGIHQSRSCTTGITHLVLRC